MKLFHKFSLVTNRIRKSLEVIIKDRLGKLKMKNLIKKLIVGLNRQGKSLELSLKERILKLKVKFNFFMFKKIKQKNDFIENIFKKIPNNYFFKYVYLYIFKKKMKLNKQLLLNSLLCGALILGGFKMIGFLMTGKNPIWYINLLVYFLGFLINCKYNYYITLIAYWGKFNKKLLGTNFWEQLPDEIKPDTWYNKLYQNFFVFSNFIRIVIINHPYYYLLFNYLLITTLIFNKLLIISNAIGLYMVISRFNLLLSDFSMDRFMVGLQQVEKINFNEEKIILSWKNASFISYWTIRDLYFHEERLNEYIKHPAPHFVSFRNNLYPLNYFNLHNNFSLTNFMYDKYILLYPEMEKFANYYPISFPVDLKQHFDLNDPEDIKYMESRILVDVDTWDENNDEMWKGFRASTMPSEIREEREKTKKEYGKEHIPKYTIIKTKKRKKITKLFGLLGLTTIEQLKTTLKNLKERAFPWYKPNLQHHNNSKDPIVGYQNLTLNSVNTCDPSGKGHATINTINNYPDNKHTLITGNITSKNGDKNLIYIQKFPLGEKHTKQGEEKEMCTAIPMREQVITEKEVDNLKKEIEQKIQTQEWLKHEKYVPYVGIEKSINNTELFKKILEKYENMKNTNLILPNETLSLFGCTNPNIKKEQAENIFEKNINFHSAMTKNKKLTDDQRDEHKIMLSDIKTLYEHWKLNNGSFVYSDHINENVQFQLNVLSYINSQLVPEKHPFPIMSKILSEIYTIPESEIKKYHITNSNHVPHCYGGIPNEQSIIAKKKRMLEKENIDNEEKLNPQGITKPDLKTVKENSILTNAIKNSGINPEKYTKNQSDLD